MPELDFVMSPRHAQDAVSEQQHGTPDSRPERRPERREDRRLPGPRQVWIHGTDANGDNVEEVQVMRNYSRGGFYFPIVTCIVISVVLSVVTWLIRSVTR